MAWIRTSLFIFRPTLFRSCSLLINQLSLQKNLFPQCHRLMWPTWATLVFLHVPITMNMREVGIVAANVSVTCQPLQAWSICPLNGPFSPTTKNINIFGVISILHLQARCIYTDWKMKMIFLQGVKYTSRNEWIPYFSWSRRRGAIFGLSALLW